MTWRPLTTTVVTAILLIGCVVSARADRTASDLITAMRLNDSFLQQCVLEGVVVQKILPPPPPPPRKFQVIVAGGQDITQMPGADHLLKLMLKYGTPSGVPLADVPAEYLPLVQIIRDGKITLKSVKNDGPGPVTHRTYGYVLAQYRGDVAIRRYGGRRDQDALTHAVTSQGNKKSSLEYFAGTWERADRFSKFTVNLVHEKALWYCFALGVGFGERVQSATLQSKRGDLYVLDAKVSIWPGKTHDARLLIDDKGIVREAEIECDTKRVRSTSGAGTLTTDTGTKLASSGRVVVLSRLGRERLNLEVKVSKVPSSPERDDFLTLCDLSTSDGLPVYYYKNGYSSKRVLMSDFDSDLYENKYSSRVLMSDSDSDRAE